MSHDQQTLSGGNTHIGKESPALKMLDLDSHASGNRAGSSYMPCLDVGRWTRLI